MIRAIISVFLRIKDLNYAKYVENGDLKISQLEDYNSHNTERLDIEGMKKLLLKLEFVLFFNASNNILILRHNMKILVTGAMLVCC